ncbi:MAG: class I SAM-dependent methyltransferase [Dehalococcoidia bacterium]
MADDDYEYRGMLASAWDLLRGDTSQWPDRAFYREVIARYGEPALDVGCGTGRLLLDYLADGLDAEGVDNSPEMLALCREKASARGLNPAVYQQQMESLDLPRRYRTIFVPSSSFLLLTDRGDAELAMERFFSHLTPGGVLVMPFMVMRRGNTPPDGEWSEWYKTGERERPEDGALVRRWQRMKFDDAEQWEHTEDRYEAIVGGEVVATEEHHRSPAVRWYSQAQSLALYERAGFGDVHAVSAFTFEPATAGDSVWTVFGSSK